MRNRIGRWLMMLPVVAAAVWVAGCAAREAVKGPVPPGPGDDPELTRLTAEVQRLRAENEELREMVAAATQRAAEDREARLGTEHQLRQSQLRVKNLLEDLKGKEQEILVWMQRAKELDAAIERWALGPVPPPHGPFIRDVIVKKEGPPKISGLVTDVRRQADDVWVQLNVGSTSNVKPGLVFIIFGPDAYKGDMVVTQFLPESCSGWLTQPGVKDVLKGDRATTSLADD